MGNAEQHSRKYLRGDAKHQQGAPAHEVEPGERVGRHGAQHERKRGDLGDIDPNGNLLEYRDEEVVAARAMVPNARRTVLLADHTTFGHVATSRLAHLGDVDTLITDRAPTGATARMIERAGCELVVAS